MAGRHKITYDEGDVYDGEWSADGKRHGLGTLSMANGCRYEGQFGGGFFQGHGVLTHPDGARYEGAFEVGKYHGYGVFTAQDGMKFEVTTVHVGADAYLGPPRALIILGGGAEVPKLIP